MHRTTKLVAGLAAGALLLVACGDDSDDATPTSKLEGTYTIGVFGPAQVDQGRDIRDGAALAAEELNKQNGAGGREIKIVFCDSENGAKPEKAVACATKFVQEDRVDAVVGGFSSGETLAMLDTVVKAQVPFVATGAASPDVVKDVTTTSPRKYIFRIGPINSRALAADICVTVVTKLTALGFKKFGVLYEDVEAFRPLADFLVGVDRKSGCLANPKKASAGAIPIDTGVAIAGVEKHLPDATEFSTLFQKLENAGADYVIEINSRQEGVALVKQWGTLKPKFALGGINVASQAGAFFGATDGKAVGELNGPAGVVRAPISPKTIPFFDAFKAKFGRDPIYNGTSTYDAIYALAEAVDRAKSVKPDDVVVEMAKTNRVGAQGLEILGPNHDVTYGAGDPTKGISPIYFQWQADGSRKIVFPASLAEGNTYQKPEWLK